MRLNTAPQGAALKTHEGTPALRLTSLKALRRSVLTSLLWESTFYEAGTEVAKRINTLVGECSPQEVAELAVEAREQMHLRHMPLFLVRCLAAIPDNGTLVADTLERVIQRPDELGEYLAIYWAGTVSGNKKRPSPISAGSKRGLARAIAKFSAFQLAKYDRKDGVQLRDILRLVHPRPQDRVKGQIWKKLLTHSLNTPDTWETELSRGVNKRDTFERLLDEDKLGGLAFLRNLRGMLEAKVDEGKIKARFDGPFDRVLPFRFVTAARYAPKLEPWIEQAMFRQLEGLNKFKGRTALIIDTSPSMRDVLSAKSEVTRLDVAAGLAILVRELCQDVRIWAFNNKAYEIPPRQGFALRDAIVATVGSYSCGGLAVEAANKAGYDRIIVLTDGEWHNMHAANGVEAGRAQQISPLPLTLQAYMINISSSVNTIDTGGKWVGIDGWSERVLDYIAAFEAD